MYPALEEALKLQELFDRIGDNLLQVSDKGLEDEKKIQLLKEAETLETRVIILVDNLIEKGELQ